MSWQSDSLTLLRNIIGDVGAIYEYDDTRLSDLVVAAAKIIIEQVGFSNDYTVDMSTGVISPDPVTDTDFMDLLVLKAWEVLSYNEYRVASSKAMIIRDGPSTIDARGVADNKKQIAMKAAKDYADALSAYSFGSSPVGKAVVSPFRVMDQYRQSGRFH
jgi:hypothetical protein